MTISRAVALAALALCCAGAHAQSRPWPAKPVKLVLPNAAASAPDVVARLFSEQMAKAVGQPWIIENRPGAEGVVGTEAVTRAAPDGYTFGLASANIISINPHLIKPLSYDPLKDMSYVAMVIDSAPIGIAVNAEMPVRTLADFIKVAKASPGGLSYSITVPISGLLGEWLGKRENLNLVQVNYKASTQSMQDGITGRVPVMINALAPFEPFVKAGKLRLIVVGSAKRLPSWPDVPTVRETYPDGFASDGFLPIFGPAGLPVEVVQRVNRETDRIVRSKEFLEPLRPYAWTNLNGASTPQALLAYAREEIERWGQTIREINGK
jgi:tripartite-type tricarboxylate transporter receptor subunit TctC